jgi:hypothetical protein
MSLDKNSTHVRLDEEMDDKLAVLSGFNESNKAEYAAMLLSKQLAAEWHMFNVHLKKVKRLGLIGKEGE